MKIFSLVAFNVRLNCLYEYVLLNKELKKRNIILKVFIPKYFYQEIYSLIQYKENSLYDNFVKELNEINFIKCDIKINNKSEDGTFCQSCIKEGLMESELIFWSLDNCRIPPKDNYELLKKIIFIKFRNCNHLVWFFLKNYPKELCLPSNFYLNHYNLEKNFYLTWKKNKINFNFSSPLEVCDNINSYINYDFIDNKYNIDSNKKTIVYIPSTLGNTSFDEEVIDKILNEKIFLKYNLFLAISPYTYFSNKLYKNIQCIDLLDFSYFMHKKCNLIIGRFSTSLRESLVFKKPVLSINSIGQLKNKSWNPQIYIKDRFNNSKLNYKNQFKGIDIKISDNLNKYIDILLQKEFFYEKKRNQWIGNKKFIDYITEKI